MIKTIKLIPFLLLFLFLLNTAASFAQEALHSKLSSFTGIKLTKKQNKETKFLTVTNSESYPVSSFQIVIISVEGAAFVQKFSGKFIPEEMKQRWFASPSGTRVYLGTVMAVNHEA